MPTFVSPDLGHPSFDQPARGSENIDRMQPILGPLGNVAPHDPTVLVDQHVRGNRNVTSVWTALLVEKFKGLDDLPPGIAENGEAEALARGQAAGILRWIHRDRQQRHAELLEFLVYRSETSEFGLAHHSPKTPEEDQQDGADCACLVKRDSLAPVIHKGEIRRYFQLSEARCRR